MGKSKHANITWSDKALRYLSELERERYETDRTQPRRGPRLTTDADGRIWLVAGEHRKLLGEGGEATLADRRPASESPTVGDLGAPASASGTTGKPKRARKRK